MDSSLLSILVNGGLSSVALVSLYIIWKLSNGKHAALMGVIKESAASNQKLADAVENLGKIVQSKF